VYSSISSDKCRMRHLSILVQFSFHSRFKLAQSCQKKSNLHTNSLNKLLWAWYSRMENICSVRQQPFEICRMRHELIEIEESILSPSIWITHRCAAVATAFNFDIVYVSSEGSQAHMKCFGKVILSLTQTSLDPILPTFPQFI
jgi:hypothetical protein